ncbi:MAG: efflux RND transporter periplasmic adaptor subunit [Nitrospinae bacterium]|nr:efflux RND transporter periplasmic adaptor subunit [Nitrospinota bacterium]
MAGSLRAKRVLILSAIPLLLAAAAVLYTYTTVPAVAVKVAEVKTREVRKTVTAAGSVQPKIEVRVDAQTAGKVRALHFAEHEEVKKGQLLVQLDDTELAQQLRQAQASLLRAEATLAVSEKTLQRTQHLFDKGYVAQEELETAQHHVAVNRATVAERRANLEVIQTRRNMMAITAPISGVIIRKYIEEGETVRGPVGTGTGDSSRPTASPTPLAEIAQLDPLEVHTNVDETEIGKVQTEQEALITVDAFPDATLAGKVTEIALAKAEANSSSGVNYLVKVTLTHKPDVPLRIGMTANVDFILAHKAEAVALPVLAVLEKQGEEHVFVVQGSSVQERRIRTGIREADYVEVLSGVGVREKVVYGDLGKLQDGERVQVTGVVD